MKLKYIPTPFILNDRWLARISAKSPSGELHTIKYSPSNFKEFPDALKASILMAWEHTLINHYMFNYIDECPMYKDVDFAFLEHVEATFMPRLMRGQLIEIEGARFIDCNGTRWHLDVFPLVAFKESHFGEADDTN